MYTIDFSFRPETYWPDSLTPEQLLFRIRGKERQKIARWIYQTEGFTGLTALLVQGGMADGEREEWGQIAPACMGGEYLPDLFAGEVEIARISMASTTSDQVSVRARRENQSIRYRIVGEYEEEEAARYELPFVQSERTLSLARLMELIDGASQPGSAYQGGILTSSWEMMCECGYEKDEISGFLELTSPFYPTLAECYQLEFEEWLGAVEAYADE